MMRKTPVVVIGVFLLSLTFLFQNCTQQKVDSAATTASAEDYLGCNDCYLDNDCGCGGICTPDAQGCNKCQTQGAVCSDGQICRNGACTTGLCNGNSECKSGLLDCDLCNPGDGTCIAVSDCLTQKGNDPCKVCDPTNLCLNPTALQITCGQGDMSSYPLDADPGCSQSNTVCGTTCYRSTCASNQTCGSDNTCN